MIHMLDTNICVYIMNDKPAHVAERLRAFSLNDIAISSIVLSELSFGVYKSTHFKRNLALLESFIKPIQVISYDNVAAFQYGELRTELEREGAPIGQLDMMIAAHALSLSATLVSNNLKEFSRVKGLRCENWA